jgi:hypothetical protein
MMAPSETSSTGTATAMIHDICTSCCSARTTPPMARMGAETSSVKVINASICTCCTSLVERVMSEGAPKEETSRSLNSLTRWKIAPRRSRPIAMAARAPK